MYELHKMSPDFPMFFHTDTIRENAGFCPHWHENIEILHIIKGSARAFLGSEEFYAETGDNIIVNSNTMHQIFSLGGDLVYHCLIINAEFLKQMGIDLAEVSIKSHVRDNNITLLFSDTEALIAKEPSYYKPDACGNALKIASALVRQYACKADRGIINKKTAKTEMVKKSIAYMKRNLEKPLTLEDICAHLGFTKCYFCHTFKEVTGITAVKMLNFLRCEEAKRMLLDSECNVSEAAERCGFTNLSYFTKTYKAMLGELPSVTKK